MKKLLLLFITGFLLLSCARREDTPKTPVDQLPPATQTGANTIGCLVNGKPLVPLKKDLDVQPIKDCFYQYINGSYEFGMYFSNQQSDQTVSIASNKQEFIQGQTYIIKNQEVSGSVYSYFLIGGGGYKSDFTHTGELKITKLDKAKNVISGTFWFDAVNSTGQVVQIREGRFDFTYTP